MFSKIALYEKVLLLFCFSAIRNGMLVSHINSEIVNQVSTFIVFRQTLVNHVSE